MKICKICGYGAYDSERICPNCGSNVFVRIDKEEKKRFKVGYI